MRVHLINPVLSPIQIELRSSNDSLQSIFEKNGAITLDAKVDSTLLFPSFGQSEVGIGYQIHLGDPSGQIKPSMVDLPFPEGREYRIIQGYDTQFTHNTDYSRYAIDFGMGVGDTVTSSTGGFVVGVVDAYSRSGSGSEWRPFSNYITVYDPNSGIFFQYVHLKYKGSFVAVGDTVVAGQPIGLVGMTGQTTVPHLHFNVLVPQHAGGGLKSIPIDFLQGYKGEDLKSGDIVRR